MKNENRTIEKYDFDEYEREPKPYTMILTNVIQKTNHIQATFIWIYLQSLPEDWRVNKQHIIKHFNISERTYERNMSWLNSVRLIEYRQIREESGVFGKSRLIVLNGLDFDPTMPFNRSAKIGGTVVNRPNIEQSVHRHRSAKKPGNGETEATVCDGHTNTTNNKDNKKETSVCDKSHLPKSSNAQPCGLYEIKNTHNENNLEIEIGKNNQFTAPPKSENTAPPKSEIVTVQSPQLLADLKQEAITDEKCVKLFNEKKLDEQTTVEELFDECFAHYASKGQMVYKSRFLAWIKRENVLTIKQSPKKSTKVADKNEEAYKRRLDAQEEAAKKLQYKQEALQVKKIAAKISPEARGALFAAIGKGKPK